VGPGQIAHGDRDAAEDLVHNHYFRERASPAISIISLTRE
jgi:hypothetical protein